LKLSDELLDKLPSKHELGRGVIEERGDARFIAYVELANNRPAAVRFNLTPCRFRADLIGVEANRHVRAFASELFRNCLAYAGIRTCDKRDLIV
jgi:hypothetical protein